MSLVFIIIIQAKVTLELNIGDIYVAQQLDELDGGPQEGVHQGARHHFVDISSVSPAEDGEPLGLVGGFQ